MRLDGIKNVTSYRSSIKLMLQLEWIVLGSSYFSSFIVSAPSPVVASIAIVCCRCVAHLVGMVRIVDLRGNASSTKCCLS